MTCWLLLCLHYNSLDKGHAVHLAVAKVWKKLALISARFGSTSLLPSSYMGKALPLTKVVSLKEFHSKEGLEKGLRSCYVHQPVAFFLVINIFLLTPISSRRCRNPLYFERRLYSSIFCVHNSTISLLSRYSDPKENIAATFP
jgi:hypothetical protein